MTTVLPAPAELVTVQVGPPNTPYPLLWCTREQRRRPRPVVWPVYSVGGRRIGEVWRAGEFFNVYVYGRGVSLDAARETIADALGAVGWQQHIRT